MGLEEMEGGVDDEYLRGDGVRPGRAGTRGLPPPRQLVLSPVIIETGSTEMKVTKRTTTSRALTTGALVLLGAVSGCKAKHEAKAATAAVDTAAAAAPEPEPEQVAVAPEPAPAAPAVEVRSRCDQYTIRESGIGAVEIGDPHEEVKSRCTVLSDSLTTNDASGTSGNIVVGVNGTPFTVQVADSKVYRMTVTDAQFRTADGMGPGMPVARMLDYPGAVVLEGEHDLSVVVDAHCGLYFRITKPATVPENLTKWADYVRALPEGTPVERVVVHGCR